MANTANPKGQTQKGGGKQQQQQVNFLFHKENYILMFAGIALLVIGYCLMSGGHQKPNEFNEDEIYSFRRITLAPIVVVAGYIVLIFSIIKKPSRPA